MLVFYVLEDKGWLLEKFLAKLAAKSYPGLHCHLTSLDFAILIFLLNE